MPSDDLLMQLHLNLAAFVDTVEKMIPQWVERRSPQGFRDTESDIARLCRQLADAITARILLHFLADPTFQAHTSLAALSASRLRAGERKGRYITLLGGSTIQLRSLEYLKPDRRGPPGRERGSGRRGKGGSGVVPVLAALGICNGATPALAEEVCHQVADSDSLRSARSALKRRGLELGHNKIRTLFNRVSGRAVDQRLRWLEHHQGSVGDGRSPVAGKRVLVAVDGGRVRIRVRARGGRRRANGHRGYRTPWQEPKLMGRGQHKIPDAELAPG